MKKAIGSLLILPVLLWVATPAALASDSTVGVIAGIMMHLNHYPSDSEKQTLANIVHDGHATAGEKALAGALMRMRHSVQGNDAATLRALASDKQANRNEQDLADILLGITHHPSANDKRRLQSLTGASASSHRKSGSWGY